MRTHDDFNELDMGMPCPHCREPLKLDSPAPHNVEIYGGPAVAATRCCSKPVYLYRKVTVVVSQHETNKECDDWGVPFKKD